MRYKNKKILWISIVSVSLAVIILAGTLACLTSGFRDWNIKQNIKEHSEVVSVVDGDGNGMISGEVYDMPSQITFLSPAPMSADGLSSVTVKVVLYPNYSGETMVVDWSVAWVNTSSAWANGKNTLDYVVVTPTSNGSDTAVVQCLQAFGEQIKLKAVMRSLSSVPAECTIDYVSRIVGLGFTFDRYDYIGNGTFEGYHTVSSEENVFVASCTNEYRNIQYSPIYGVHTAVDEFSYSVQLTGLQEMCDRLNSVGSGFTVATSVMRSSFEGGSNGLRFAMYDYPVSGNIGGYKINEILCSAPSLPYVRMDITVTGVYSVFVKTVYCYASPTAFLDDYPALQLDVDSIYF